MQATSAVVACGQPLRGAKDDYGMVVTTDGERNQQGGLLTERSAFYVPKGSAQKGQGQSQPQRDPSPRNNDGSHLLEEICRSGSGDRSPIVGLFERRRRRRRRRRRLRPEEQPDLLRGRGQLVDEGSPFIRTIESMYFRPIETDGGQGQDDGREYVAAVRQGDSTNQDELYFSDDNNEEWEKRRPQPARCTFMTYDATARTEITKRDTSVADSLSSFPQRRRHTCRDKTRSRGANAPDSRDRPKDGATTETYLESDVSDPVKTGLKDVPDQCLQAPQQNEDKTQVGRRINRYNRSVNMEAFHISPLDEEKDFEGALRFYLEEGSCQVSKALRLRGSTTVRQLLPLVVKKFNLERHLQADEGNIKGVMLLQRWPHGDIPLEEEDKPLTLALTSPCRPRFVVRTDSASWEDQSPAALEDYRPVSRPQEEKSTRRRQSRRKGSARTRCDVVRGVEGLDGVDPGLQYCRGLLQARPSDERDGGNTEGLVKTRGRRMDTMDSTEGNSPPSRRRHRRDKRERRESSLERFTNQFSLRKGSLRLSRSMTNLVHKTFSLRHKEHPLVQRQSELSTEETAPGVLKVFGDTISPGAEYKSVLATPASTARELVKEVLERYNVSRRQVRHYVLCDVIGRFVGDEELKNGLVPKTGEVRRMGQGMWLEECLRIVGDHERPLTIQDFWKPSEQYARRFEIRRRADVASATNAVDTVTCGINANARRMVLSRTRVRAIPGFVPSYEPGHDQEEEGSTNESFTVNQEDQVDQLDQQEQLVQCQETDASEVPDEGRGRPSPVKAPSDDPFLITLRGYDPRLDNLVYVVRERVTMVGSPGGNIGSEDICLHAPDVQPEHCWLSKSIDPKGVSASSGMISLDPLPGASVQINHQPVETTARLRTGDILSIGSHYLFLFRSPLDQDAGPDLTRLCQSLHTDSDHPVVQNGAAEDCKASEMLKWRRDRSTSLREGDQGGQVRLHWAKEKEDALIECILATRAKHPHAHPLTMSYLVCLCLDNSLAVHDVAAARDLAIKLTNSIYDMVWEAITSLAKKHEQIVDSQMDIDVLMLDLHPLIYCLSNLVELHNYIRTRAKDCASSPKGSAQPLTAGDTDSFSDILVTLESLVTTTFQQTVFYLTKGLYPLLPAILDSNPFMTGHCSPSGGIPPGSEGPTMEELITMLQTTLLTLTNHNVHYSIKSQLFCYMFFFIGKIVFNKLMEKEAGVKYYKWTRGVQLRGNMDALETWATSAGMSREAGVYLTKINTLANLLATPRLQLLTANWEGLRRDFPGLNCEQLLKVLTEYDLGPRQEQPEAWVPPEGAINPSNWSRRLAENLDDHPPIKLPAEGFVVDLSRQDVHDLFTDVLQYVAAEFSISDDDGDSGLSVSQTLPVFTDVHQSPIYVRSGTGSIERETSRNTEDDYQRLPSPVACRPGTLACGSAAGPVPPKRRPKEERHRHVASLRQRRGGTSCDASDADDDDGDAVTDRKTLPEPDLGDSGISISGDQVVAVRAGERHRDAPPATSEQYSYLERKASSADKCNASQVDPLRDTHTTGPKALSSDYVQEAAGRARELLPNGAWERVPGASDSSRVADFTCTGPLAVSSPTRSDGTTPSPSIVDASRIPPQPKTPAPTLDRSSIKRRGYHNVSRKERSAAAQEEAVRNYLQQQQQWSAHRPDDEVFSRVEGEEGKAEEDGKIIDVPYLMPSTPDGVVNGLRVLPLSEDSTKAAVTHGSVYSEGLESSVALKQEARSLKYLKDEQSKYDDREAGRGEEEEEEREDVIVVNLTKGDRGLGLGLIDGMFTPLRQPGIYVRTLVPHEPAAVDGRLKIGDRILAVNGLSVVGADYPSAMQSIRDGGKELQFLVAQGNRTISMQITASSC